MEIKKLDVFCKVVELKSFTKAAEAVRLSQPTVSDHIRNLEEEVGQQLLDRLGREVEPTPVGRLLYGYAIKILRLQQETLQALAQFNGNLGGNIFIGASTIPGTYILPQLISTFRDQFPAVKTVVHISGSRAIARKVMDGEYDLGLVGAIWNEKGLEWIPLFEDTLTLVAHPASSLVREQPLVVGALLKQPFILREPGSGTRKVMAQMLETIGYKETDLQEVAMLGSNEAVKEAVKAGLGISMLSSRSVAEDLSRGTLVALVVEEISGERPFYLIRRRSRAMPPAASAFAEHLMAAAAEENPA
jgi:DNA-binding transcriptional LysR family regulator